MTEHVASSGLDSKMWLLSHYVALLSWAIVAIKKKKLK